ncbi:sugar efflux transporter [Dactylosporangium matsuzakiense]|uniref:Sugar efflux transporter SetB n=1 Tax=Dactylosporangium matsuzakiense TaxID=53360 RepID=A0A9W6KT68_9ACTN|nr:sugar efflux transporter [Dactylosporangium matsuzakiense]GLL06742.1 sugar efflux transporter SetB [Dactylosporangium matsuzakiense]
MTTTTDSAASARPRLRGLARTLLPLSLMFLAVGMGTAVVFPFIALFLNTELHAGPGRVTLFLVASPLAGVLVTTLVGRLSDRGPYRRWILVIAALGGVTCTGLYTVVRDYWVLLALSVSVFALSGSLFPQTFAYARQVLERDSPDRAAFGISAMRTVFSLAWVGGPALAALLLDVGGFRLLYGVASGLYLTAALVAVLRLETLPAPPRETADESSTPLTVPRPLLWATVAAFVLLQTPMTLAVQALPLFISRDLHAEASAAGLILGLCAALEIPLMLGLGALTTRFRLGTLVRIGAACAVVYYAIGWASPNVWVLAAAQPVNAAFIAAISGVGITYMQDMMPGRPGHATTLFTNTFPIGAMLAGSLLGVAAHFGYRSAWAISTGLCLAGLLLLLVARARRTAR